MVGNNAFGMSFIFKQCMKNAQNYGEEYMLLSFLVTLYPSSSMFICLVLKDASTLEGH